VNLDRGREGAGEVCSARQTTRWTEVPWRFKSPAIWRARDNGQEREARRCCEKAHQWRERQRQPRFGGDGFEIRGGAPETERGWAPAADRGASDGVARLMMFVVALVQ
jgi:hypothetical protein